MTRSCSCCLPLAVAMMAINCGDEAAQTPSNDTAAGGRSSGGSGSPPANSGGAGGGASGAGTSASGGSTGVGAGGRTAAGGMGNGGLAGDGGSMSIGGAAGNAGSLGNGGSIASGGSPGSGGVDGSGGAATPNCTPPAPGSVTTNPLFTDTFTADPAPLVHDCTFYITCGHDEGSTGFFLREWYVLSSKDLVTWERQVAFRVDLFSWANANAWASQMVEKDGRFYWYVPVQKNNGTMAIGVATATSPAGPFADAIGGPLVDDEFEMSNMDFATPVDTPFTIDPTVFVDDDGRAYLHYGSFFRMVNAELGDDMISIRGTMRESTPQGFFEAPFLTKKDGVYYEVYARDGNPAKIDYATSDSPLGPWQHRGRILDPLPNNPGEDAATSHPGIAEFHGDWYLVYHLSHGSAGTYRRQVAMEKLTFNADGTIQKVTPSDGIRF